MSSALGLWQTRTIDCENDLERRGTPRYDFQCADDQQTRERLSLTLLVILVIVVAASFCVFGVIHGIRERRLYNTVRTLPTRRLPVSVPLVSKAAVELLSAESDRPGSDVCKVEPEVPGMKDTIARTHIRTTVAQSYRKLEMHGIQAYGLARRPNQTLREYLQALRQKNPAIDTTACQQYAELFERATCSALPIEPDEYTTSVLGALQQIVNAANQQLSFAMK